MSWEKVKLIDIGSTYTGLSNKKAEDFGKGKPYITYLNIFNNSKIDSAIFDKVNIEIGESQSKAKYGDIFFTTSSETPDEVGMSSVLLDDVDEVYLNSFCFGFRLFNFEKLTSKYARYCFRSEDFRKQIGRLAQGSTRYNLSKSYFLQSEITIPTNPKEQQKIADILESVDNTIANTKFAIEKYKLIKQGMMQDLLTRGIDKDGKLRPTYEEAPELYKETELGFIPMSWNVYAVSEKCNLTSGGTPSRTNEEYWNGNIPWITTSEINFNRIITCNQHITKKGLENSAAKLFEIGTILIAMYGQGVTRGKCSVLGIRAATNQACAALNCSNNIQAYLYHYLTFSYERLRKFSNNGSQENLSLDLIGKFGTVVPDSEIEQKKIADRLTAIDNKTESEQKYLEKLKKIKQGLMQDLLTGKVRCKV